MAFSPSTLADLRSQLGALLRDAQYVHYSQATANDAINEGVRRLWDDVVQEEQTFFAPSSQLYTWPAQQMEADLSAILGVGDYYLLLVQRLSNAGAVSYTNQPRPLDRINAEELYQHPWGEQELVEGAALGWAAGYGSPVWARRGTKLYLDPPPGATMYLRLLYLTPPVEATAGGDQPVPQSLARWEHIAVTEAALWLIRKDRLAPDTWTSDLARGYAQLHTWIGKWMQDGQPKVNLYGR